VNSEQVIHMSRLQQALLEMGIELDVPRMGFDADYLNEVLVAAMNHPQQDVQESAYILGVSFGLVEKPNATNSVQAFVMPNQPTRIDEAQLLPEISSEPAHSMADAYHPADNPASEPAALVFYDERENLLRRYIGGLR
jgi:hypothetical protein